MLAVIVSSLLVGSAVSRLRPWICLAKQSGINSHPQCLTDSSMWTLKVVEGQYVLLGFDYLF